MKLSFYEFQKLMKSIKRGRILSKYKVRPITVLGGLIWETK
jgi:hypothetical protein